jgi:MoaA/NifB/PqqE/SkfB family radical SAM enzyme
MVRADERSAEAVLRAIRPLAPGAAPVDGVVLDAVEAEHEVRLRFSEAGGSRFSVRFQRGNPEAPAFARAGRLDLILDVSARPSRVIERFARALAARVLLNTAEMEEGDIDAIVAPLRGAPETVSPALRRRATIGGANLIDINVGDGCNLDCTFCTDVDSRGRQLFRATSFWVDELARARDRGKAGLLISGNEPTLRPDLPEIVAAARRLGFVEIELSTAGVRLSDRGYLAELLDAGVNVLAVSIHGSNAVVDGAQTGRPDFFEPRRRGFEHFLDLVGGRATQEEKGVFLKTITIFTRDNLGDVPALVAFLDGYEVSYILLHYPWVKGAAAKRFDDVVPDYAAVVRALEPLRARLRATAGSLAIANLPPCVAPDLSFGVTPEKDIVRPSSSDAPDRLFLRTVSAMDPTLAYAGCCDACALRSRCGGVPRRYLERFGETGLHPAR